MHNIIKKATRIIFKDDCAKENRSYPDESEIVFCKNNVCVHVKTGHPRGAGLEHCPGYLTCKSAIFVDQSVGSRRQTLLLTWIPNNLLCVSTGSETEKATNCSRKSITQGGNGDATNNDDVAAENETAHIPADFVEGIWELKSELQPLLGNYSVSIDSLNEFFNKTVTAVEIVISNPKFENSYHRQTCKNKELQLREAGRLCRTMVLATDATTADLVGSRRFSIDLCKMRSLRIVFLDEHCTSGYLVVVSRESKCQELHFHHGGLDHLAKILHQWHSFLHISPTLDFIRKSFLACRPGVAVTELHPDEHNIKLLTTNFFYGELLTENGRIPNELLLRKYVFFGRLDESLRKIVWPFLLNCYSYLSTFEERTLLMDIKKQEYEMLTRKRLYSLSPEEHLLFWKDTQGVVEHDIAQCSQLKTLFCSMESVTADIVTNILLNYAIYNPNIHYFQSMVDFIVPILYHIQTESEVFWSFTGMMQTSLVSCTYSIENLGRHIFYLEELTRTMLPTFYDYLKQQNENGDLCFCQRWLQYCFKYEFTDRIVVRIWEACWTNYLTDYFHLFICLAIIGVYANDVILQNINGQEIVVYFNSLAMYIDGSLIIQKARGLLYDFRKRTKIPCTLSYLCKRFGPGIYDTEHNPTIECIGHNNDQKCSLSGE